MSVPRQVGPVALPSHEPDALADALASIEPEAASRRADIRVVRAPGRVNLIGEHTDYNEGFVLPAAIDLEIRIAFIPTDDRRVVVTTARTGEQESFLLDGIGPATGRWIDYVAGTAWSLAEAGVGLTGLRGLVAASLPESSGLASSAALELASAWALTGGIGSGTDAMTTARLCQRAENAYVGAHCGLMDQAASSLGIAGAALFLDCRTLEWRAVPLPLDEHALVVCHTGSERRLVASDYNARRAQCERAVALLRGDGRDVRALRDVTTGDLPDLRAVLDDEAYARAEHVVTEDERALRAVEAFESGDLETVGQLFAESHASLRDRFEVSSPELDALVAIAVATPGVVAARMTGAGLGGCTVNIVRRDAIGRLRERVEREYPIRTGRRPRVWVVEAAAGAGVLV